MYLVEEQSGCCLLLWIETAVFVPYIDFLPGVSIMLMYAVCDLTHMVRWGAHDACLTPLR